MTSNVSASQDAFISMLYVSTIDVNLARDSEKTIESFQLRKNNELLQDVQKTICAGEGHRIEFNPSFALNPEDRISVLVNCNCRLRKQVNIDISLRDVDCMREEQGGRSYRKKVRKVVVVVNGHQSIFESLLATTTPILQSCSRFRLLVIGNSGVGKSSLIHRVFGVKDVRPSGTTRGIADINQEFVSRTNERFVVHDSLGFEAGDERNIEIVKQFVAERKAMPHLKDRLHAIWLCLETPYSGGRLLEAGVEKFLERRDEILGKIPLVVVLTKVDLLDAHLELEMPADETLEHYKSRVLDEHCIQPLRKAAGNDVTHVTVSVEDGHSESLSSLVTATLEHLDEYHADEAPRVAASIAQRVSIKEKVELSIEIGKKKYWQMLFKSNVFRGHTLNQCLQVIRDDVIIIWNFIDPDKCLTDDKIMEALLNSPDSSEAIAEGGGGSSMTSLASLLASALELLKGLSGSGEATMAVLAPVASITISLLKTAYEVYREAKKDVKILMAYIVDLMCVMQIMFLLTSSGRSRVTLETTDLAVRAYQKKAKKFVHMCVDAFDGKQGVFPGGRDYVLDEIEALIWRYSITEHEFEDLSQRLGELLPANS